MWLSIDPSSEPYPRQEAAMWALSIENWLDKLTPELLAQGYNTLEELGIIPHEIYYSIESKKDKPGFIKHQPTWFKPSEREEFLNKIESEPCLNET